MARKILVFLLISAFSAGLLAGTFALAEETDSSSATGTRQNRLQNVKDRAQNLREKAQEKRENLQEKAAERKAKLEGRRVQNIRKFFSKMGRRLEAALGRLENITERIASRIKKFEERGANVTEAKTSLEEARARIAEAKAAFEDAKSKLEGVLNSDDPKVAFKEVREGLVKGVAEKIKAAHQALVAAIRALKGTGLGDDSGGNAENSSGTSE